MKTLFCEAIKIKDGIIYNLEYHQARIDRTLSEFYETNIQLSDIRIPQYAMSGLYKCRVVYGNDIESVGFSPYTLRQIKNVRIVIDNSIDYRYKYIDRERLNTLLGDSGCDEIIIVKNGLVTDASFSNLVFESGGRFYTPVSCLLQGTKRQALIDSGVVAERNITLSDIHTFNQVFFINAMIDIEDGLSVAVKDIQPLC